MKIKIRELEALINKKLQAKNISKKITSIVSEGLVWASSRGIDSHGVRLLTQYIDEVDRGILNIRPNVKKNITGNSYAHIDADHTFGHYSGVLAMKETIKLAKKNGIGCCAVSNSSHCGAMSYFGYKYAPEGFISIAMTHASPRILLPNTNSVFFGNNPISFIAPISKNKIFCFDSATTKTTFNEIRKKKIKKQLLSKGEALDENGVETVDPNKAMFLQTIGGYKGIGLSFMVDILCGALTGMAMGSKISKMYNNSSADHRKLGHFFIAIDIDQVYNINKFEKDMQKISRKIKSQKKISKKKIEPLLPGELEDIQFKLRSKMGIDIDNDFFKFIIS